MERCDHDISNVEIDLHKYMILLWTWWKSLKDIFKIIFMEDYLKFLNSYNTPKFN